MEINLKTLKAVIFDMDGTLIDSTGIWHEIDKEFFAKRGMNEIPKGYADDIVHMGLTKGAEMTIERYDFVNDTVEGVVNEWQLAAKDMYENHIQLKPGAIEFLEYLKKHGIFIALATANDEELYRPCLRRLGVEKYFDIITDVNKVKEGKKSPKIYDSVIKDKDIGRAETMILEDTIVGLNTSFTNGFITVGVDDEATKNIEEDKRKSSHFYIHSFYELMELFEKLR